MELFLVQHGEAKSETEDPERPLTDRGAETVVRMAACSWPADPLVK
jgi:phosphohistidine phosphatase SixA